MQKMSLYKLVAMNTIEPQNSLSAILVQKQCNQSRLEKRMTNKQYVRPYRNHIALVGCFELATIHVKPIIFYVTQQRNRPRSFFYDAVLGLTVVVTW